MIDSEFIEMLGRATKDAVEEAIKDMDDLGKLTNAIHLSDYVGTRVAIAIYETYHNIKAKEDA